MCTHDYCRCMRAAELASIADRTGDPRYLYDAIHVHGMEVVCRLDAKCDLPQFYDNISPSAGSKVQG
jgi:hypothetical protein